MARLFDDAAGDDLQISQVDVTAFPVTMACWVRPDAVAADSVAMSIRRHNQVRGFDILLQPTTNTAQARVLDGTAGSASSKTSTWALGTWGHLAGVFSSITSRIVVWDGAAGGEDVTSRDPFVSPVMNRTTVGMRFQGSEGQNFSGDIAEAAIWTTALTIEEIQSLANGYSPLLVRPESLLSYWPIIGRRSPEVDLVGGTNLTVNGAVASAHPRIIQSSRPRLVSIPALVASSGAGVQALTGFSQSGVGVLLPSGLGAQVLSAPAQSGVGAETLVGAGSQVLSVPAQSGVGVLLPSGLGAQVLSAPVQSGVGAEVLVGVGAQVLVATVQSGVGVLLPSGAAAQVLGILAQSGVGAETLVGAGVQVLGILAQSGVGILPPSGAGTQVLTAISQSGVGVELILGSGAQIFTAFTQAGIGLHITGVAFIARFIPLVGVTVDIGLSGTVDIGLSGPADVAIAVGGDIGF